MSTASNWELSQSGQVTVSIRNQLHEETEGGERLIIRVEDTGRGIPEDQQAYIFDRFFQVDASATRKGEGTGVGLALTKELVVLLGGEIRVESTVGSGSTFTVTLPITRSAKASAKLSPENLNGLMNEQVVAAPPVERTT